ncbi:MAG TPA: hypothetical protein QGF58_10050 [Myxococcota bacterium]|nr:hypothetical protein [Myxococcota bacterium]
MLLALPPVEGLPPVPRLLVADGLALAGRKYASGDQEPNVAGDLWLMTEGCVALRSTGHFHRVLRGPTVLSPSDVGFGGPDILVLQEGTVLCRMAVANALLFNAMSSGWAHGMLDSAVADLEATRAAREATFAGMADYFEASGALMKGPYRSTTVRLVFVVVEDDPPPPLPWNVFPALPGSKRWIRAFSHYTNFKAADAPSDYEYQELAQLIPCVTTSGLGFHSGRMFPDGVMPTAVGRELYAFPKRCGEVWMDDHGGGAAFQGKFMFHAEWSGGTVQPVHEWMSDMTEAFLPGWAGRVPSGFMGLFTRLTGPVISRIGIPLRVFTERKSMDRSPMTPLGNNEMVRAPFRFTIKEARSLSLDWLYDVNRFSLKGIAAFEVEVDINLHESYAVRDRTGLFRALRNPWLAAQVPFRTFLELLP